MFKLRKRIGDAWLRFFGWEVEGGPPPVPKAVVVAAPHTSNWDFPFTIAIAWSLEVEINWLGKHTLFRRPFGTIMRAMGGIPVDRRGSHNLVEDVANKLKAADHLLVLVAPEGTRSTTGRWKTGFYTIAVEAKVPIVLGYLDYARKRGGLGDILEPKGELAKDVEAFRAFYKDVKGHRPEKFTEVRFSDEAIDKVARQPRA
jgi:1-acyl-sn-glycerol-3-phosphate acyltransferase